MYELPKILASAICASPDAQKVAAAIEYYAKIYRRAYNSLRTIPFMRDFFNELIEGLDIRIE